MTPPRSTTDKADTPPVVTAAARYAALETNRSSYVNRAEVCSALTIPSLFPKGGNINTKLEPTYQSVGARGVNNLAAKLLLALFPAGSSFFRLELDDMLVDELAGNADGDDARAAFEEVLGKIERSIMVRFEQSGARAPLFLALKHLLVAGNGLVEVLKKGKIKFHSLRNYVVARDLEGNLLELVIKESLARDSLPTAVRAVLPEKEPEDEAKDTAEIDIYTRACLEDGRWMVCQEIDGKEIPGTRGTYPLEQLPYLPLRFITIDGEDYGRSYCEEYLGDLATLESLSGSIVDFAAVAARILLMVDDGGITSLKKLQDAPNGAIIRGRAQDVTMLQLEKSQDFGIANAVKEETRARLEQIFLLASSVQRNAERVTAEEIRVMAGELEQTLGGIYSVLSQVLQLPLVTIYMTQLQRAGKLPTLPKEMVTPQIVTGLEGLGRNTDLQRLTTLVSALGQTVPPENIAQYLNIGSFLKRVSTALGIDAKGLIRSDEEVAQNKQQEVQQQIAQNVAPNLVQPAADPAAAPQGQ